MGSATNRQPTVNRQFWPGEVYITPNGVFYTFKRKHFELLIEAFVKWLDSRFSKIIEIKVVKIGFGNASALEWPSHKASELT